MTCQPRISTTLPQREHGQSDPTLNPRLYHRNVTAETFTASLPKNRDRIPDSLVKSEKHQEKVSHGRTQFTSR